MSSVISTRSIIPAGGAVPLTDSSDGTIFQTLFHRTTTTDAIAAGAGAPSPVFSWGGSHDIIDSKIVSIQTAAGEQIPVGIVATNTHTTLDSTTKNSLNKTILRVQVPAAGVAIPAGSYIDLALTIGSKTRLNPAVTI